MENLKIKVITGFREDQYYVIDGNEAHKAYYLFMHPEERGVFKNGVALIGKNIQGIEPAWNETMGWNPTHDLDNDDWNDIHQKGIKLKMRELLTEAKRVMPLIEKNKALLQINLFEIIKELPQPKFTGGVKELAEKYKPEFLK
jgi:hypothetical protein